MGLNPDSLSSWIAGRQRVSAPAYLEGARAGMLTILTDRGGAAEDHGRVAAVLAPSAYLPGRSERGRAVHCSLRVVKRDGCRG